MVDEIIIRKSKDPKYIEKPLYMEKLPPLEYATKLWEINTGMAGKSYSDQTRFATEKYAKNFCKALGEDDWHKCLDVAIKFQTKSGSVETRKKYETSATEETAEKWRRNTVRGIRETKGD